MKSYVVVNLTVVDKDKLSQYSARAAKTVENFNGKFIAKGPSEPLFGESGYTNKAIIEFPSKETAKKWYESQEYQDLISLRNEAMSSCFEVI